ncbi:MAG: hypothetical protein OXO50_15940 [Caldilineaceae bacterium]|nr:hypothetical protein [Caldilineaceae bacterium]
MKRFLIITAVLAFLVPGALLAQDELTLEGLAEQIANLADRVNTIESEIAEEPVVTAEGKCIILHGDFDLHPETATKFLEDFEEIPSFVSLEAISFHPDTGTLGVLYVEYNNRPFKYVTEYWSGCQYEGSSQWTEGEYTSHILEE